MARDLTVGQRLRRAIEQSDYSGRSLAQAIADRDDVTASAESLRRQINKWVADKDSISLTYQVVLEEVLSLPVGYLFDANPTVTRQRELERTVELLAEQTQRVEAAVELLQRDLSEAVRALRGAESEPTPQR